MPSTLLREYPVPLEEKRVEFKVINSLFIATVRPVFTVEQAKVFINRIRAEYSDASHNVPLYIIGQGSSSISHCSDDGEPSGTAGRPALAVLSGSGLGDVAVVITRYFGGTKLGTGGLVHAYSDAVRLVLDGLPRGRKENVYVVMMAIPYNWLDRFRIRINKYQGLILEEIFEIDVTLVAQFPIAAFQGFQDEIKELTGGKIEAVILDEKQVIVKS